MLQKFILHFLHEKLIFCFWFFIWIIFNLLFLNIFNTILIIIIIIINTNFKLWFIAHLYTFFFQRCLVFLLGLFLFIFSNWFLLRSILLEVIPVINILWFYTIFIICLILLPPGLMKALLTCTEVLMIQMGIYYYNKVWAI